MSFRQKLLFHLVNFWPPFLAAGIHVDRVSDDHSEVDVSLKLAFWNRNYVGTQYGGSLYSMTDPFYMLMLIKMLGPGYIVWDKGASIDFKKPGTSKVYARFRLSQEQIHQFKKELEHSKKIEPILKVEVTDGKGEVIAVVTKILYIKRKLEHKISARV